MLDLSHASPSTGTWTRRAGAGSHNPLQVGSAKEDVELTLVTSG